MRLDRHHNIEGGDAVKAPKQEAEAADALEEAALRRRSRVASLQVPVREALAVVLTVAGAAVAATGGFMRWGVDGGLLVLGAILIGLGVLLGI